MNVCSWSWLHTLGALCLLAAALFAAIAIMTKREAMQDEDPEAGQAPRCDFVAGKLRCRRELGHDGPHYAGPVARERS